MTPQGRSDTPLLVRAIVWMDERKRAALGLGENEVFAPAGEPVSELARLVSDFDLDSEELIALSTHVVPRMVEAGQECYDDPGPVLRGIWIDGLLLGLAYGRMHERERAAEVKRIDTAPPVVLKDAGRGRWGRRKRES